ncbi:MAG: hypothetical protein RID81_46680, partial [Sandaracinaceae bacterium]
MKRGLAYVPMRPPEFDYPIVYANSAATVEDVFNLALRDPKQLVAVCDAFVESLELVSCFNLCRVLSLPALMSRASSASLSTNLLDRMIDAQPDQTRQLLDQAARDWLNEDVHWLDDISRVLRPAIFEATKRGLKFSHHVDEMFSVLCSGLPDDLKDWPWLEIACEMAVPFRHERSSAFSLRGLTRAEILHRVRPHPNPYQSERPTIFDAPTTWRGETRSLEAWWWLALRGYVASRDLDELFGVWLEVIGGEALFSLTFVASSHSCPSWVTTERPASPGFGYCLGPRIFRSLVRREAAAAAALLESALASWPAGETSWVPASERLLGLGQVDALHHGGSYRPSITSLIEEVRVSSQRRRAFLWDPAAHDPVSTIVER